MLTGQKIGVKYINISVKIPYRYVRSLKKTVRDEIIMATPSEKIKTYNKGIGKSIIVQVNSAPVKINTKKNEISVNARLTSDDITRDKGNIYFGT